MRTLLFAMSIHRSLAALAIAIILPLATLGQHPPAPARHSTALRLLHPREFQHYIHQFAADELEATGKSPSEDAWPWLRANIPFFTSSDKSFEEMYYFRWYAWQKHVVRSSRGYLITEWLPKPAAPDGFFGVLPDAAPLHLGEARWLRDPRVAEDYARFWTSPGAKPREYSFPLADSVRNLALATGDASLGTQMLPGLLENDKAWDATHLDPAIGLYWSIDTRDAMEKSISGDGYRPTLNSYILADANAIAAFAITAGQSSIAAQYTAKAQALQRLIETRLWNPQDKFYEVVSPASDSGILKEKRFRDPGTRLQYSGVRELIGYIPWLYYQPPADHDVAWQQLFDPHGFAGKYGPTTAERRSPRFRFASTDQCTWNGPAWPYATTQTLLALANLLNGPAQTAIGSQQYYQLFSSYVLSQHIQLPSGRTIDWIDEDLDADTDEWIAKNMLIAKQKQVGRGNYYNHSGFADPLITGLIGLRPRADNTLVLHPLLPPGQWTYFALDGLPYHGHILTILFDQSGAVFHRGRGLTLFVDGKRTAHRATIGPLQISLPRPSHAQAAHETR